MINEHVAPSDEEQPARAQRRPWDTPQLREIPLEDGTEGKPNHQAVEAPTSALLLGPS